MIRELEAGETARAWPAMRELRPHLASLEAFVEQVDGVQRPEGYRLVAAFDEGAAPDDDAVAAAGFRVGTMLSRGRHLYVDDLVTLPGHRGRGHGRALLDWVADEARRLGCARLHLDSGHDRTDAHRLYLAWGLADMGRHFGRSV